MSPIKHFRNEQGLYTTQFWKHVNKLETIFRKWHYNRCRSVCNRLWHPVPASTDGPHPISFQNILISQLLLFPDLFSKLHSWELSMHSSANRSSVGRGFLGLIVRNATKWGYKKCDVIHISSRGPHIISWLGNTMQYRKQQTVSQDDVISKGSLEFNMQLYYDYYIDREI